MMRGAAACSATVLPVTFNGTFTTSGTTATITSSTRTVTRAGTIKFQTLAGDGTPQYSKNGGAFDAITEGLEVVLALSDTLAVRATGLASLQSNQFDIVSASTLVEEVVLERT